MTPLMKKRMAERLKMTEKFCSRCSQIRKIKYFTWEDVRSNWHPYCILCKAKASNDRYHKIKNKKAPVISKDLNVATLFPVRVN